MRRVLIAPLLSLLAMAAGCAATPAELAAVADKKVADETELARLLKGYTAGAPETCLPQQSGRYNTKGVGDTLLYSNSRRVIYRNDTTGCSGVERGEALVTINAGAQLCRGQIAQTIDLFNRNPSGSCTLGDFVPYYRQP